MKGLKENIQDKKGKLERSNTRPNSPKPEAFQRNLLKRTQSHPGETALERLDFLLAQSHPGKKSLSPNPTRLNMRRETQP